MNGEYLALGMTKKETMDATTKAVIETISDAGYGVLYGADPSGHLIVEAIDLDTTETFIVSGADLYEVVIELAKQVGINLEDR